MNSEKVVKVYSKIFKNVDMSMVDHSGKVQVVCPFHTDTKPSAGINPKDGFFHCFTCDITYNSLDKFLAAYHKIPLYEAQKLGTTMAENVDNDSEEEYKKHSLSPQEAGKVAEKLKVSLETIDKLGLLKGGRQGAIFTMPVMINGVVLDLRSYAPGGTPKVKGAKHSHTGLIAGYDLWLERKNEPVLICAGEKDFIKAIDQGYNAISITGGERAIPKMFKGQFKNKDVVIFYDNDDAGKQGAIALASFIHEAGAKSIKNITDHYSWMEDKEDLFDFFEKYGKTKKDLDEIIEKTPILTTSFFQKESRSRVPLKTLREAKSGEFRNMIVQSDVQVHSTYSGSYSIPKSFKLIALIPEITEDDETEEDIKSEWVDVGHWTLSADNMSDILYLIDDEAKVEKYMYKVVKIDYKKIPKKVSLNKVPSKIVVDEYYTVHRGTVVDFVKDDMLTRADDDNGNENTELDLFTIEDRLENGKSYNVHYKIVPHPKEKNKLVGIVVKTPTSAMSEVDEFKLTDEIKNSLVKFKCESVDKLFQRFKGFAGNYIRKDLFMATDLTFHSPLRFNYHGKVQRGVIYASIIGESRTGKSEAVQSAIKTYGLGRIVNAKLATLVALIGGSTNASGGWKTTSGIIPRYNKSLIALEELQGADNGYHQKITEVKSSGKVRIARADGELNMDALVRLVEISNQKTKGEMTKKLEEYVNGVEIIRELINANEDIARQDFFVLVPDAKKLKARDDMEGVMTPFSAEDYNNRVLWVWSRRADQIVFENGVLDYIWTKAEELNKSYKSHVKIFGSETDIKLARLSVAYAAMLVSTDDSFESIIVDKKHVDAIVAWLISIYDNDLFRLREFVEEERSFTETTPEAIKKLEDMYHAHPILFSQLDQISIMERSELEAISGMEKKDFNKVYNELFRWKFIKLTKSRAIAPTMRFRISFKEIDKEPKTAKQKIKPSPAKSQPTINLDDLF